MLVVRPARPDDIDALTELAEASGPGMTNLPVDRSLLDEKIERSLRSFEAAIEAPGDESYLLLMEDLVEARIVGSCAIFASVGLERPFYSFRVINLTHTSQELNHYEPVEALQMVEDYRGSSEIATLFLTEDYRRNRNGRFLSRCRFLFLAEYPERFASLVMAEMRGALDENGHSVFWNKLGRQFINMDFTKADYLSSLGQYQFIADMMPKYPVYIRLLPKEAQEVIGVPHEATRPALELLQREGFRFEGCVDVFDAGPTVHCPLDQIRTVRESRVAVLKATEESLSGPDYIVSNTRLPDFLIGRGRLSATEPGEVVLERDLAEVLGVSAGSTVRYAIL